MRALVLASLLMVLPVLVGCINADDDVTNDESQTMDTFLGEISQDRVPATTEDLSTAVSSDHGGMVALHAVPELHKGSHAIELVGHNPLTRPTEGGVESGDSSYIAVDVWNHLVCIAHFAGTTGTMGGATIVDISDPANPTLLASLPAAIVNSDCQFTDDGKFLVLATYITPSAGPATGAATGITGMNAETAIGLAVYDVTDPSNPEYLFQDATTGGNTGAYHNVFTANKDGVNYIFQTYSGQVLKINDDATGLELVSTLEHSDHDLWVGQHPITGEWMVVTGAGGGTAVFLFEDPENPELLGVYEGSRAERTAGWHRQWPVDGLVDGKAYMVVAGEECGNGDSLPYQVLDWSDPTMPVMVGQWWIPGKPANPGVLGPTGQNGPDHLCEMNSHEFEIWNGYVASGNYHAGVWLFDVATPERATEPATIGYYMPTEVPQTAGGTLNTPFVWSPNTWGAYFDDRGYIITADWHSGIYVLEFEGTNGEWPEGHMMDDDHDQE